MKLINKFTLWFLCITLACSVIGSGITFYNIEKKIDQATISRLKNINNIAAEQIRTNKFRPDEDIQGRKVAVTEMNTPLPAEPVSILRRDAIDPLTKKNETVLTINSYYSINNKNYLVSSYCYFNKSSQILSGLEISLIWKWAIILFLIAISARLVSRVILSPLTKTMSAIQSFNLQKKEKLQLPETSTKEFKELNHFVKGMTDKAVEEYASLKEFTENASHELQTPVAVMRNKLELLGESSITNEQALLITDIQNSLDKLSRINSSLVLLTRLENNEYATNEPLHFCKLINASLANYQELTEMKSITLTKNVAKSVYVPLHAMLGDLLLNNLISNAIRHNIPEGNINVELTHSSLTITNTGLPPSVPTEELFQRFKKGNQCNKSIGIGLAIVKQICDIHQFPIKYIFENGLHIIEINFKSIDPVTPKQTSADHKEEQYPSFVPQPAL